MTIRELATCGTNFKVAQSDEAVLSGWDCFADVGLSTANTPITVPRIAGNASLETLQK